MVSGEENKKKVSQFSGEKKEKSQKDTVQKIEIVDKKQDTPTITNKKDSVVVKDKKKNTGDNEKKKQIIKQAVAIAKNVRLTPRKARLVAGLVRNKTVNQALSLLQNLNKKGSTPVFKVVKSAASNAVNNYNMNFNNLYIDTIYVNDGIKFVRMIPKAKGSSARILKRTCHITVIVKEKNNG